MNLLQLADLDIVLVCMCGCVFGQCEQLCGSFETCGVVYPNVSGSRDVDADDCGIAF